MTTTLFTCSRDRLQALLDAELNWDGCGGLAASPGLALGADKCTEHVGGKSPVVFLINTIAFRAIDEDLVHQPARAPVSTGFQG